MKVFSFLLIALLAIIYFLSVTKIDSDIKRNLPDTIKDIYGGYTWKQTWKIMYFFVFVLFIMYWLTDGAPKNRLLVIDPREIRSLPAIFFSNFFHGSKAHLTGNIGGFLIFGTLVIKQEGTRGLWGILLGCLTAGATIWVFGAGYTLGFSGAVFACLGILIVRSIRTSIFQTILLIIIIGTVYEVSFFETIRPTEYTNDNRISWLGHLGGLIGGMMSQIRNRAVAAEILFRNDKITSEEFITIANRIDKEESASAPPDINKEQNKNN